MHNHQSKFTVFSTCPQSKDHDSVGYLQRVIDVAQWSEQYGYDGILVYADKRAGR